MPKKTKNDDRFLGDVLVVSVVVFSLIIATVCVLVPTTTSSTYPTILSSLARGTQCKELDVANVTRQM